MAQTSMPNVGTGGVGTKTVLGGQPGSTFNSIFESGIRGPAPAIKRAVVALPDRASLGPDPTRIVLPTVTRDAFGMPDRTGIDATAKAASDALIERDNPTQSSAFKNIMGAQGERSSAIQDEVRRAAQDSASRAGYAGGFNASVRQANADRFKADAEAGYTAAGQVREQGGEMYKAASSALTGLMSSYNDALTKSNVAYATTKAEQEKAQATIDFGLSQMVQDKNLSFMEATNAAHMLQGQLDQAYNGSLIDVARYNQMSSSLDKQLANEQARLAEQGRQFDVGLSSRERQAQLERDAQMARLQTSEGGANSRFDKGNATNLAGMNNQAAADQARLREQRRQFDKQMAAKAGPKPGSTFAGIQSPMAYK